MTQNKIQIKYIRFLKYLCLFMIGFFPVLFFYFWVRNNFRVNFGVLSGCFLLTFVGASLRYLLNLMTTPIAVELSPNGVLRQTQHLNRTALGSFWLGGLLLFAGLLTFARPNAWHFALIFFTGALIFCTLTLNAISSRRILRQNYELYRQQQVILDQLAGLRRSGKAPLSDGLLA